jgi:hypothetical protein
MALLAQTEDDPNFQEIEISRTLSHNGLGHTLMAQTWKSAETIPYLQSFYRKRGPTHEAEVRRFYAFGNGLNSHPHILHGGVLSTVLDSTMSNTSGLILRDAGYADASVVTVNRLHCH